MKPNQQIIILLNNIVDHLEYYNSLAPFPIYDTEYIEDIKHKIESIMNDKTNYDELPVVACKHCRSLYIENDDVQNEICMRCGSTNEVIIYKDIYEYLEKKNE